MKTNYPEIKALNEIYTQHKVEIQVSKTECLAGKKHYPAVTFTLGSKTFEMFADDEYDDFRYNYPLLNLCVVLRELEYYNHTEDYLLWCGELGFEPKNTQVLDYYRDLGRIYREISAIIGKIDSFVNSWDFEMGSGASWELRGKSV